jgi:TPR repeat protein
VTPRLNTIWASAISVAKDWVEAYKWLLLAARQGDEDAKAFMTIMESKLLTSEQIAQEQKRAREFKPR